MGVTRSFHVAPAPSSCEPGAFRYSADRPSPPGPLAQKLGVGEPTAGPLRPPLAQLLGEGPGVRAKTQWPCVFWQGHTVVEPALLGCVELAHA